MLVDCANTKRAADMSVAAAQQLRAVLAKMEASIKLHSNKAIVKRDFQEYYLQVSLGSY